MPPVTDSEMPSMQTWPARVSMTAFAATSSSVVCESTCFIRALSSGFNKGFKFAIMDLRKIHSLLFESPGAKAPGTAS